MGKFTKPALLVGLMIAAGLCVIYFIMPRDDRTLGTGPPPAPEELHLVYGSPRYPPAFFDGEGYDHRPVDKVWVVGETLLVADGPGDNTGFKYVAGEVRLLDGSLIRVRPIALTWAEKQLTVRAVDDSWPAMK